MVFLPVSRNTNNVRQRIWGLMVTPYAQQNVGSPAVPARRWAGGRSDIRIQRIDTQPAGSINWQTHNQTPANPIPTNVPGSMTTADINNNCVWLLTMMDSSYYNLIDRARQYVFDNSLPMERMMLVEIVPTSFDLNPRM